MKQVYKLQNLDCANCAAKMEAAIGKIPGVTAVHVGFLTQKLALEGDDARFPDILEEAARLCKKIEPDCTLLR